MIRGSAKAGLEGTDPELGSKAINALMEACDSYIAEPKRVTDADFSMPVESIFSIEGRGTVVTGRIERGKVKVGDNLELVGLRAAKQTTCTGVEMFKKLCPSVTRTTHGTQTQSIDFLLLSETRHQRAFISRMIFSLCAHMPKSPLATVTPRPETTSEFCCAVSSARMSSADSSWPSPTPCRPGTRSEPPATMHGQNGMGNACFGNRDRTDFSSRLFSLFFFFFSLLLLAFSLCLFFVVVVRC